MVAEVVEEDSVEGEEAPVEEVLRTCGTTKSSAN